MVLIVNSNDNHVGGCVGCGAVNSNYKHVCGCFSIFETVGDGALLDKKIIAGRLVIVFF